MNNVPIELLQVINDQLDFFDQIHFKGVCKLFHKKIIIKQYIPNLLIVEEGKWKTICSKHFICLDKFYSFIQKHSNIITHIEHSSFQNGSYVPELDYHMHYIYILIPNKPLSDPMGLEKGDFYPKYRHHNSGQVKIKFDLKTFIMKCFEITNKMLTEKDEIY